MSKSGNHKEHAKTGEPKEFYPFREQEKEGIAQVHYEEYPKSTKSQQPNDVTGNTDKRSIISNTVIIILGIGIIAILSLLIYFDSGQDFLAGPEPTPTLTPAPSLTPTNTPTPTPTFTPTLTPTPTLIRPQFNDPDIQAAFDTMLNARSYRVQYESDVTSTTIENGGSEARVQSQVNGIIFGSTNSQNLQIELQVINVADPNRAAVYEQIVTPDQVFFRNITADQLWKRRQTSDYNRLTENFPFDASTYAYNFADSLFSDSRALIRSIIPASLSEEDRLGNLVRFRFRVSIPEYLRALELDSRVPKDILDREAEIVSSAQIEGTLTINIENQLIEDLRFSALDLTGIPVEESTQLNQIKIHDMQVRINITDVNDSFRISPPT